MGNNKKNLLYFEATSMEGLYNTMEEWQSNNEKRFLSTNIQKDNDKFCCIALTNPTEVVIVGKKDDYRGISNIYQEVYRTEDGALRVKVV